MMGGCLRPAIAKAPNLRVFCIKQIERVSSGLRFGQDNFKNRLSLHHLVLMRFIFLTALLAGTALAAAPLAPAVAQKLALKSTKPEPEEISLTKTYPEDITDDLPAYAGGPEVLRKFLFAHVIVPPFALANQLAGAVDVEFVLHPDGRMDSMRVSNGACCGLDEEALRVANLTIGKWSPAKINGVQVKSRVDLPITFRVANKNSRSIAYYTEMKTKYATYQSTTDQQKDQLTYQEQITKQTAMPAPAATPASGTAR